jgi:hypothetical protein
MELTATNAAAGRSPTRGLETKGQKMKTFFKAALVAGMFALTTVGASADGIGIHVGPVGVGIGVHHHRVCRMDRDGYRRCVWR